MINLTDYGFNANIHTQISPTTYTSADNIMPARVTAVHKERYDIVCDNGETHAKLKTSIYFGEEYKDFPTTGDFVLVMYNPIGDSLIVDTLTRSSFFSRRDPTPGRVNQAVAANFDYVFIMQSLNLDFNLKRLERYLTLSWQSGAIPVVILTKSDLIQEEDNTLIEDRIRTIEEISTHVAVFAISAKTGYGISDLSQYLKAGKTIVLLGSSGVGKSSFLNALSNTEVMSVNSIREDDSKGKHTTTYRQLVLLENGVMIIDTPGMRELGMSSSDLSQGLSSSFADVDEFLGMCKFSDCKHQNEPGCAINAAIERGELTKERYESYLKLKKESRFSENKSGALQEKWNRNKQFAKSNRQKGKQNPKGKR